MATRAALDSFPADFARRSPAREAEVTGAAQTTLVAAGALLESTVHGNDGRSLGKVAEIMLVAGRGEIAYVVVARGGLLGLGETLHAVSWCDFTIDPVDGQLSLDLNNDDFDLIDGFDKDHWPSAPAKIA